MPQIGQFTREESGFIGNLGTLLLHQDIIIVADPSDAKNAPDYRVQPDDAGDVAVWLSTDEARFVTGQSILVDGGYTIGGLR